MAKRKPTRNKTPLINQHVFALVCLLLTAVMLVVVLQQQNRQAGFLPAPGEIRVHFIDVGQGDSILVQSADHTVLIDAGPPAAGNILATYLDTLGIRMLDYVVVTHPHNDHIGGMPGILDRFNVREVWMPDAAHDTVSFERLLDALERNDLKVTAARAGDVLSAGLIQMIAVSPNRGGYENLNNYSIVLHMRHGYTSFLFTGDAEALSENEMIAAGWDLQADILKVGHHGSRTSSSDVFLNAVDPKIAVIILAADNRFGHPHHTVLYRFAERGIEVLRTDELGTIVMSTDGEFIYLY